MKSKRNVVVFGGGNGSAVTLRAMKRQTDIFNLSAAISTCDSGGSSGRLREEFGTLPAGDILRAVMALSPIAYRTILRPYLYKRRYEGLGKIDGHNLGNLFLVLLSQYTGDFVTAIRALEQSLDALGHVYPSTVEQTHLVGELQSGEIVKTEAALDRPKQSFDNKIKKVWLEPKVRAYEPIIKIIEEADFILLGPGSLYTSIIASILPSGIKDAIGRSKAKLIYIAGNKYEIDGETGPTKLHDFVGQLEFYLPRKLNAVVFNNMDLSPEQKEYYDKKNWGLIEYDKEKLRSYLVFAEPFERQSGGLSAEQLGRILREAMT
jgi:uncharacterized cofD-like protein